MDWHRILIGHVESARARSSARLRQHDEMEAMTRPSVYTPHTGVVEAHSGTLHSSVGPTQAQLRCQPVSLTFDLPHSVEADQIFTTTPLPCGDLIYVLPAANLDYRRGFGRQSNKGGPPQQDKRGNPVSSPTYQSPPPLTSSSSSQNLPNSPALSATMSFDSPHGSENSNQHRNPPFFFREKYATLIVKGNFMTLAAKPVLIEEGEWLAHQGMSLSMRSGQSPY